MNQLNTATAIKGGKTPRKPKVLPVYDHEQGNVNQPKPLSTSTELSLVGLPAPHETTIMPVMPLELSAGNLMVTRIKLTKQATQLNNAKPVTTASHAKKPYRDPYGKRWPNPGTSAGAIWAALVKHGYVVGDSNKAWVYKLDCLNLQCDKGPVNYVNLTSEINSYRKYLINNDLTMWPVDKAA